MANKSCAIVIACMVLTLSACGPSVSSGETSAAECSDGLDNDRDGAVDCADFACGVHSFCAGMTPDAGPLPSSCGPSNCGGCCSGETCLAGNSGAACGAAGDVCIDCGPDRLCSSGSCSIDPASRWNVIVESVHVNAQTAAGDAWDAFGGAPDPLVNVYIAAEGAYVGSTTSVADTFDATFNQRIATGQRAGALEAFLSFEVLDEDTTSNDFIGHCSITVGDDAFDAGTLEVDCPRVPADMQSGFTLRWHLERN